jgi:hypothetical protein
MKSQLTKQLCYLLSNAGYQVAGWDVEWNFGAGPACAKLQTNDKRN